MTDVSGDAVLNHLRNRTARQRKYGCAASHGLDHHQSEWLVPLNREQQTERFAEQFIFHREICFADILDELSVEVRLDLLVEVSLEHWLNFANDLQRHTSTFGDFNRNVRALHRRNASEESKVRALFVAGNIQGFVESVMYGPDLLEIFKLPLKF